MPDFFWRKETSTGLPGAVFNVLFFYTLALFCLSSFQACTKAKPIMISTHNVPFFLSQFKRITQGFPGNKALQTLKWDDWSFGWTHEKCHSTGIMLLFFTVYCLLFLHIWSPTFHACVNLCVLYMKEIIFNTYRQVLNDHCHWPNHKCFWWLKVPLSSQSSSTIC